MGIVQGFLNLFLGSSLLDKGRSSHRVGSAIGFSKLLDGTRDLASVRLDLDLVVCYAIFDHFAIVIVTPTELLLLRILGQAHREGCHNVSEVPVVVGPFEKSSRRAFHSII